MDNPFKKRVWICRSSKRQIDWPVPAWMVILVFDLITSRHEYRINKINCWTEACSAFTIFKLFDGFLAAIPPGGLKCLEKCQKEWFWKKLTLYRSWPMVNPFKKRVWICRSSKSLLDWSVLVQMAILVFDLITSQRVFWRSKNSFSRCDTTGRFQMSWKVSKRMLLEKFNFVQKLTNN